MCWLLLVISATMVGGSTAREILTQIIQNSRFATNWYVPHRLALAILVTAASTIIAMLYELSRTRAVKTKAQIGLWSHV